KKTLPERRLLLRNYLPGFGNSYRNVHRNVRIGKITGMDFSVERNALERRSNRKTKTGLPGRTEKRLRGHGQQVSCSQMIILNPRFFGAFFVNLKFQKIKNSAKR